MITGSSPRVRGKRHDDADDVRPGRLIPARAGKTSTASARSVHRSAHPRACGENDPRSGRVGGDLGSSPRVRGKLDDLDRLCDLGGLIPARAGKTSRK